MAEEASNPDKDVPRAINMVLRHGHRGVHRHVTRRAVGDAGREQCVRVDRGQATSCPSRSSRARSKTFGARERSRASCVLPDGREGVATFMPPADTKPSGEVLLATASSSRGCTARLWAATSSRTRAGRGALHSGQPRLAPRHPWRLGRHPRRDDPGDRDECRSDRRVAARLLYRSASSGATRPWDECTERLTPYVSIIVFGMVACLIILPGSTLLLADLYAFGAMISFTAAHMSVVVLRVREPDLRRPFRSPSASAYAGSRCPSCRSSAAWAPSPCGASLSPLIPKGGSSASRGWPSVSSPMSSTAWARATCRTCSRPGHRARVDAGGHRLQPDPRAHHGVARDRRNTTWCSPASWRPRRSPRSTAWRPSRCLSTCRSTRASCTSVKGRQGPGRRGAHRRSVQGEVRATRQGPHGRPDGHRRAGDAPLGGYHPGHSASAASPTGLRPHHLLRDRPLPRRGPAQSRAEELPHRSGRRARQSGPMSSSRAD